MGLGCPIDVTDLGAPGHVHPARCAVDADDTHAVQVDHETAVDHRGARDVVTGTAYRYPQRGWVRAYARAAATSTAVEAGHQQFRAPVNGAVPEFSLRASS